MKDSHPKIAIVHDFLIKLGGAEEVLKVMHEMYPHAPIYTILYDKNGTRGEFEGKGYTIIPSRLQKYPYFLRKRSKIFLSKFPRIIESIDLSEFDLVITSSNSYSHGVITKPSSIQICYCYSPTRYLWDWYNEYLDENNIGFGVFGLYLRNMLSSIRVWDYGVVSRTNIWVAISETVAKRISKYYHTHPKIIYPPTDLSNYLISKKSSSDYFLIISRLSPYKKIDIAVDAFNNTNYKLIIVGEGSEYDKLKSIATSNIKFLGWVSEKEKIKLIQNCKALVFPGEEDFGLTPIEAMSCGKPVIAYKKGGVSESVLEGVTGTFFEKPDSESLRYSLNRFSKNNSSFDPIICRKQAEKFSKDRFVSEFSSLVESTLG